VSDQVPDEVSSDRDPRTSGGSVMRLVLSPRWLMWHVLTLGAMATCGFLAAWQWGRAGSAMGSAVNVGYGLQWPVFAVFFAWIWWRMLRMEITKLPETEPEPKAARAPAASGRSPFAYRPGRVGSVDETENPGLAEYNRMLAALAAQDRDEERQEGR
jgi:DNA-binding transcriptional regulator of glucitol operon